MLWFVFFCIKARDTANCLCNLCRPSRVGLTRNQQGLAERMEAQKSGNAVVTVPFHDYVRSTWINTISSSAITQYSCTGKEKTRRLNECLNIRSFVANMPENKRKQTTLNTAVYSRPAKIKTVQVPASILPDWAINKNPVTSRFVVFINVDRSLYWTFERHSNRHRHMWTGDSNGRLWRKSRTASLVKSQGEGNELRNYQRAYWYTFPLLVIQTANPGYVGTMYNWMYFAYRAPVEWTKYSKLDQ